MDPITHTMTGAALAGAGLRKATPLAAATLVLAANAPDVDVLVYLFGDSYDGLALRRGWTHGPLALLALPFLLTALALAWDRWVRRRRAPRAEPARAVPLFLLALLGTATHPALDWLNNYGIRLLMPFDGRWFYGDALFIVDPWVWLGLGGALFLLHSRSVRARVAWAALAAPATLLIVAAPVPVAARVFWGAGITALVALRALDVGGRDGRLVRWSLGAVVAYSLLMVGASATARRQARAELEARGLAVERVMVAPEPANPFAGSIVAAGPGAYRRGTFRWLANPRVVLSGDSIPLLPPTPAIRAAARTDEARDFLAWSRFPFFEVEETPTGTSVFIGDARYAWEREAGSLGGVVVRVE